MSVFKSVLLGLVVLLAATPPCSAETLSGLNARIEARAPNALATAEAFAKANAGNADAWIALARARIQAGKSETAIAAAEKATRLAPDKAEAHFWLGNAYGSRLGEVGMLAKMGMAPKLRDAFERAVVLDPAQLEARYSLIEFYLQAPAMMGGGIEKARAQALEIGNRDKAKGLMAKGRIALHEKKTDEALKYYQAALAAKPGDAAPRIALALVYQQLGRWKDAFELLRAWTRESPGTGSGWYQLARASAMSGEFLDEGAAAMQRYLTMPRVKNDPENKHALYRLGQIHARAGRKAQARTALEAALKLDPKFADAKAELGKL